MQTQLLANFKIAFSEKIAGNFQTTAQIAQYLKNQNIQQSVCHLRLEHGTKRLMVNQYPSEKPLLADAIISQNPKLCLSMVVADCYPVVIIDQKQEIFALIHAGWRSLVQNILELTILDLKLHYHSQEKDLLIWIGPGIKACCYQAKHLPMQASLPNWQTVIKQVNATTWSIDLFKFIHQELQRLAIKPPQITSDQHCTACSNDILFSHHRAKLTGEIDGRFLVAVWKDQQY